MNYPVSSQSSSGKSYTFFLKLGLILVLIIAVTFGGYKLVFSTGAGNNDPNPPTQATTPTVQAPVISDSEEYDNKMAHIVNGDTSGNGR